MDGKNSELGQQLKNYRVRQFLLVTLTILLLLIISIWGIWEGSAQLSAEKLFKVLTGKGDAISNQVVFYIRMPRVMAAIATGAGLSISGAVIQTVIRNPLGSPFTLGLSAASAFGAALAIVVFGAIGANAGLEDSGVMFDVPWLVTLSAFLFWIAWRCFNNRFCQMEGSNA
ncbi:iron chelate uptake ABC transporter family permease subunit [Anaerophaga thermohalophila]|uniref:iron chelate uptake ABC transporter family permease subunit n=1 Tax=Anaerophaga thermohalophila TaxID=177400 RepID=UPI0006937DED|nr:iron chelate uptake ABC transporter family permease subunit [Anaerophaga thermohalophila]